MGLIALNLIATAIFLAAGTALWERASRRPPLTIRSESGRSPEEYAFRKNARALKDAGMACLAVGGALMLIFAGLALQGFQR